MTWYRAPLRKHLDSIRRHGLVGVRVEQNRPGCDAGVYLSREPAICVLVMVERYLRFGDPDGSPGDRLAEIAVIVIDETRVDERLLRPDPLIDPGEVCVYKGVIDVAVE
jgi:hypothetical protein